MKRFLKIYLPIFITLFSLTILLLGYLLAYHFALLQYSLGYAKIIYPPINAVVKVNNVEQLQIREYLTEQEKLKMEKTLTIMLKLF